ncbi:hypothetical protein NUU61_001333 [Penicillium alfredii]|uniref:Helitron helicase-like domain-containing protein n=1 Tax=Penicillium alfredii TaxID=1506179 RepID=A0A9W9KN74_9EURO|nr:uncharacterized protein NUU61_001333 [Penicillium alfredii]KAJ5111703.1 hypothetical protein NUU61_001333 [Penicillium alfredii]
MFSRSPARFWTIEHQKRGLPYMHLLLFLDDREQFFHSEIVDKVVCAELLEPQTDPTLYCIVRKCMVHVCGGGCERREQGRCRITREKNFLFDFQGKTYVRGREVEEYLERPYIEPSEAIWRLLFFRVHQKHPAVIPLAVHLPGKQPVSLPVGTSRELIRRLMAHAWSILMGYFEYNAEAWCDDRPTPRQGPRSFVQLLLTSRVGPTCFDDLRTVIKAYIPGRADLANIMKEAVITEGKGKDRRVVDFVWGLAKKRSSIESRSAFWGLSWQEGTRTSNTTWQLTPRTRGSTGSSPLSERNLMVDQGVPPPNDAVHGPHSYYHIALKSVLGTNSDTTGRFARGQVRMQEYDLCINHVPGKTQVVTDGLSRIPTDRCQTRTRTSNSKRSPLPPDMPRKDWISGLPGIEWKLARCVQELEVSDVLSELHDMHGHYAIRITLGRALERYWRFTDKELTRKTGTVGVRHIYASAQAPWSVGLAERIVRQMVVSLRKLASQNPDVIFHWDLYVGLVVHAINTRTGRWSRMGIVQH